MQEPGQGVTNSYYGTITLVNPDATFQWDSSKNDYFFGGLGGVGQLTLSSSGTLSVSNAGVTIGGINISGSGSLWYQGSTFGSSIVVSNNISLSGTGSLLVSNTGSATVGGNITQSSSGTVKFISPTTITILGNNNANITIGGGSTPVQSLYMLSSDAGTGSVAMPDNSFLIITNFGATQWSPSSLTLGTSAGMTLNFIGLTNSGTTTAGINPSSLIRTWNDDGERLQCCGHHYCG